MLDESVKFFGESIEGLAQAVRCGLELGFESSPGRAKDSQVELGAEESDHESEGSEDVAVSALNAGDEAAPPEASQVVGHLVGAVVRIFEQSGDLGA